MTTKKLDTVGWYIATLHQMMGHQKAAAVIGEDVGDSTLCILCLYEKGEATKNEVIERLGVGP